MNDLKWFECCEQLIGRVGSMFYDVQYISSQTDWNASILKLINCSL